MFSFLIARGITREIEKIFHIGQTEPKLYVILREVLFGNSKREYKKGNRIYYNSVSYIEIIIIFYSFLLRCGVFLHLY